MHCRRNLIHSSQSSYFFFEQITETLYFILKSSPQKLWWRLLSRTNGIFQVVVSFGGVINAPEIQDPKKGPTTAPIVSISLANRVAPLTSWADTNIERLFSIPGPSHLIVLCNHPYRDWLARSQTHLACNLLDSLSHHLVKFVNLFFLLVLLVLVL